MHTPTSTEAQRSNTQTAAIDAPAHEVFDFLADPENLPRWAVGFCYAIRRVDDRPPTDSRNEESRRDSDLDSWVARTANGDVTVRVEADRARGIVDFHLSPAPGVTVVAYSRVLPRGDGAEYVFTQHHAPGMPDEVFDGQVAALAEELRVLQSVFRARAACAVRGA